MSSGSTPHDGHVHHSDPDERGNIIVECPNCGKTIKRSERSWTYYAKIYNYIVESKKKPEEYKYQPLKNLQLMFFHGAPSWAVTITFWFFLLVIKLKRP